MRYSIPLLILILAGCATREEKQHASDAIAGGKGAVLVLQRALQAPTYAEAMAGIQAAIGIIEATAPRVENAVSTPAAELPPPAMTPKAILADPEEYAKTAPPAPAAGGFGAWLLAAGGTAAFAALWGAKRLLPLVPGLGGPAKALLELAADSAYTMLAHADQKKADDVAYAMAEAAGKVSGVLALVNALPPGTLPVEVSERLRDPTVAAALAALTKEPSHA